MKKSVIVFSGVFAVVAVLSLLSGCGTKTDEQAAKKELVLMCGSSFVSPTEQLCSEFEAQTGIKVVLTSAGSEDFLPLVKAGSKGDILVTHDPYLDYVKDASAYAGHAQTGFVAPVLAVQKGNPLGLKSLDDLTKEGLRVALSNPEYSTCGEMVFGLIEKKGIKDAVLKNVGNRLTKGHSTLGTYLKTQSVDAVIMWNGVANTFADVVDIVPTPYEYDEEIRVHVIGLSYSAEAEAVKQFIEFVKSRGETVFAKHGYVK